MIIAPSLLAADWKNIQTELDSIKTADWLHLDVMDGAFVPPITFGPKLVKACKNACSLPLDVHLMIEKPENHIEQFVEAGANLITVHQEACNHLHRVIELIKSKNIKAGVALNPSTPVSSLEDIVKDLDLILIMSVNPGWGGQKFIESSLSKITQARELINKNNSKCHVQVDGGVSSKTAKKCLQAGACLLYTSPSPRDRG